MLPANISREGGRIDSLLAETHVLVAGVVVVAIVALIAAVVVGRRGTPRKFAGVGWRAAIVPVMAANAIFFIVDGNLFVTSNRDMRDGLSMSALGDEANPVRLQVNGRQWAWNFRLPGSDDTFGTDDDIYTTGELVIPVGRPVSVQLAAMDVVHALYIPNLRVKTDAIPGRVARLWFEATEPGTYDIACAQHCGVGHTRMAARLVVKGAADWEAWVAQASRDAARVAAAARELAKESRAVSPLEFPRFGEVLSMAPRGWGWPWREADK